MSRLRVTGKLLGARPPTAVLPSRIVPSKISHATLYLCHSSRRLVPLFGPSKRAPLFIFSAVRRHQYSTTVVSPREENGEYSGAPPPPPVDQYPSPPPERAKSSAKLAALHARLSLPLSVPFETLARAMVDSSAEPNLQFSNTHLAFLGRTVINYYTTEYLIARYPRLPMEIMFAAMKAYAGPRALFDVATGWGVEAAAAPGGEVDPGLLQFDSKRSAVELDAAFGYRRKELAEIIKFKFRVGTSSRVVFDDEFGDRVSIGEHERVLERQAMEWRARRGLLSRQEELSLRDPTPVDIESANDRVERAFANMTRAVVGTILLHQGRDEAKSFVHDHILSRKLDLAEMFAFTRPTEELAKLCAREGFEKPVARLLSETGRLSRTPVFVVGIYSGHDRLGEGWGPSLDHARLKAAMNALKSWYLYSPGEDVRLPSETYVPNHEPWEPIYIDIGEVVT